MADSVYPKSRRALIGEFVRLYLEKGSLPEKYFMPVADFENLLLDFARPNIPLFVSGVEIWPERAT